MSKRPLAPKAAVGRPAAAGSGTRAWAPGLAVGALAGLLAVDVGAPAAVSYRHDGAGVVVACAIGGALLWRTRLREPIALATAALGLLWLAVAFTPLAAWLCDGLVRRDPPRAADAIVVLGSRLQTDGDPTVAEQARLVHALELIAEGYAPRLVVTELPPPSASHATLARAALRRLELRADVLAVGPVLNTHDEAVALAALCRKQGLARLIVVTSPTHSRRGAATVEAQGIDVISSPSVEPEFDLESLDWPTERLRAFGAALHERLGLVVYRQRGWLRPGR